MLSHVCTYPEPLVLCSDDLSVLWTDEALHRTAFESDPEFYALIAFAEGIHPWQQARILLVLLTESRRKLPRDLRNAYERITLFLLVTLPTEHVLTVFQAVCRLRAEHRHAARAVVSYLLQHPEIETLVRTRTVVIRECLEHALGDSLTRYWARISQQDGEEVPLPAMVRRYGGGETQVRRLLNSLSVSLREPPETFEPTARETPTDETFPAEVLVPLLRQFYRVGTSPELVQQLETAVTHCASALPDLSGKIALILDASASMRGSQGQEFAPIALAVAFERVLQTKCSDLRAFTIGGFGWPPAPEGPTDFGRALIDALEGEPELVVFVTDGYENLNAGDAARILATIRTLGISLPIVCCHVEPDLCVISPEGATCAGLMAIPLRTELDFRTVLQVLDLLASPQTARPRIFNALLARQQNWETEVLEWTVAS